MKYLFPIILILTTPVMGGIYPPPPFYLVIDVSDGGRTWLEYAPKSMLEYIPGSTGSGTFGIVTYEIRSSQDRLAPQGWTSIADQGAMDPVWVTERLGSGALTMGELIATPTVLAEGSLTDVAIFREGEPFYIGVIDPGAVSRPPAETVGDISFSFLFEDHVRERAVVVIPEPSCAAMLMFAFGCWAAGWRRRRPTGLRK